MTGRNTVSGAHRKLGALGLSLAAILPIQACASAPQLNNSEQASATSAETLSYELTHVRPGQELFWRVQSDGQVWVKVPSPAGFAPQQSPTSPHRYIFAQGEHRGNVGPETYRQLQSLFADVISGQFDQSNLTNADLRCVVTNRDVPSGLFGWTHPQRGGLKHPFACLGPKGTDIVGRYNASWTLIAEAMIRQGQAGVVDAGSGLPSGPSVKTAN
jgi:hypothetical protein